MRRRQVVGADDGGVRGGAAVLLAVAAISVNALAFFGWCAAFDDDFRDLVRVYAASPAYGQGVGDTCAFIERALDEPGWTRKTSR